MDARRIAAADARRDRIVSMAAGLLDAGGREAVSTRAVCTAAGVQAPTLYRLFGDKRGLLDAVAAHGFMTYMTSETTRERDADPVENLRAGWDLHIGFGLANPFLYSLIFGDPHPGAAPPAVVASAAMLAGLVREIATAGRLRLGEKRAAELLHAASCGTTLTLIAMPADRRDLTVSHLAREVFIAAITTEAPASAAPGPASAAVALRALVPQVTALTGQERGLLLEWLDRIAETGG